MLIAQHLKLDVPRMLEKIFPRYTSGVPKACCASLRAVW